MYCSNCGKQIPDDAKYCWNCGSPISTSNEQNNKDFEIVAGELVAYHGSDVDVTIPNGVRTIGGHTALVPNYYGKVESEYQGVFSKCTFLRSVIIPDSVVEIGPSAFFKCSRLQSVQFPKYLETIGHHAFFNCRSLSEVSFQNSPAKLQIGTQAFEDCVELKQLILPENVASIGNRAFFNCGITNLVIKGSPKVSKLSYGSYQNSYDEVIYEADYGSFSRCPITTLSALEEWKKENCWSFPKALSSYCSADRKMQIQKEIDSQRQKLTALENQYRSTGFFARSEKARLKEDMERVNDRIRTYQGQMADWEKVNIEDYTNIPFHGLML